VIELPPSVESFVDEIASTSGVEAVVLGGSRAEGTADPASDWDLGVFYRGEVDWRAVSRRGDFHPPGSWGRLMNGGAWLTIDDRRVDVILRDLDVVEHWAERASRGDYELDALLGYSAGFPTYTLVAEVAASVVVRGRLDVDTTFTDALVESTTFRWGFQRDFSVDYARSHAARGNRVGVLGNLTRAVVEEAHRRVCEGRRWVLNEKRLIDAAGLSTVDPEFADSADLDALIERVTRALRP
jgi:hypothetical protein